MNHHQYKDRGDFRTVDDVRDEEEDLTDDEIEEEDLESQMSRLSQITN